jgi:hypothetical protein
MLIGKPDLDVEALGRKEPFSLRQQVAGELRLGKPLDLEDNGFLGFRAGKRGDEPGKQQDREDSPSGLSSAIYFTPAAGKIFHCAADS